MNIRYRVVLTLLVVVAAACAGRLEPTSVIDTTPSETVDGSALPPAASVEGSIPLAGGLVEVTTTTSNDPERKPPRAAERPECRQVLVTDVLFESGQIELTQDGLLSIGTFAESLGSVARIEITGHTDNDPISMGNQKLSELRAESVATALEAHLGRRQRIISVIGMGDTYPIASNDTVKGKKENRRVEIKVNCGSDR